MRELLNTLREDIGMSNEGDDLDIDTKYHKSLNKAIYMDKEKDKENSDLTAGSQYLTLRKFGYTGSNAGKYGSQSNLNISSNDQDNEYRLAKLIEPTTAQIKSSLKKKSSYDDYETQIIKNIQSIRRNSKGSNSSDNNDNNNSSLSSNKFVKSVNVSMNNNENEINSISPSPQLIQNKRITLASTPLGPSKETNSNATLNENINSSKNFKKKDEDDDDEFVVASKLKLTDQSSEDDEIKNKSKSPETLNKSNLSRKSNINESFNTKNIQNEYSEDVLFNNDYGESDKNESEEEEEEKNDGELSKKLLKTKTFNRNDFKKLNKNNQSSDSDENEHEEEAKDKVQDIKPSVSPRKFTNQSSKKKFDFDQSDDDEF
jgi:hypothetical protein